jgi:hypothetical protein
MRRVGFFFFFCHLTLKQNTVSLKVCPHGRYGLYVESIFSHCLAVSSVLFSIGGNVLQLGEVADFEARTFNLALNLIKNRMFNLVLNAPFCQTAVICCPFIYYSSRIYFVIFFLFSIRFFMICPFNLFGNF